MNNFICLFLQVCSFDFLIVFPLPSIFHKSHICTCCEGCFIPNDCISNIIIRPIFFQQVTQAISMRQKKLESRFDGGRQSQMCNKPNLSINPDISPCAVLICISLQECYSLFANVLIGREHNKPHLLLFTIQNR